jgi:hypothetical protein
MFRLRSAFRFLDCQNASQRAQKAMESATTLDAQRDDLERKRQAREQRWVWIGAAIAVAVFFVVFRAVYEDSIAQSGPLKCKDGWRSPSIGIQGACSNHGGIDYGPLRSARRVAWFAGLPAGVLTWFFVVGVEYLTSPFRRKLKALPTTQSPKRDPNIEGSSEIVGCPRCGGEFVTRIKYYRNQLPDRSIWKECKKCKNKEYMLLE